MRGTWKTESSDRPISLMFKPLIAYKDPSNSYKVELLTWHLSIVRIPLLRWMHCTILAMVLFFNGWVRSVSVTVWRLLAHLMTSSSKICWSFDMVMVEPERMKCFTWF